jgi:hypothetical protein
MNLGQLNRELERLVSFPVLPVSKIGGLTHTIADITEPILEHLR